VNRVPVVIVDDSDADRYIVKRRLSKSGGFGEVKEARDGVVFLEDFFNCPGRDKIEDTPLLVLMDVNMPGLNGFETIEELQRRVALGEGPASLVVMMFTSSSNPEDLALAENLASVKGYIQKPLDEAGIEKILEIYHA
jgi:CheY-like chemotaxis protein